MNAAVAFVFILLMLLVGHVLRGRGLVPAVAPDALNTVVLYVCLPASIALYAPKLALKPELAGLVAIPWLLAAFSIALVLMVARWRGFVRGDTAVLLLELPLGNTSFLGFVLVPVLAGEAALPYAVVYDQFGSFLLLSTFGLSVIAMYTDGARPTPATIARRVLTFPPFIVLVLALIFVPAAPPAAVDAPLRQLAGALLPLAALAIGMQMKLALPRQQIAPLVFGLFAKLILLPATALGLCWLFGLDGPMRAAAVLEAAMPPMITAAALLTLAGLGPELAAALVGYGIVGSIVTLPAWGWLLTRL